MNIHCHSPSPKLISNNSRFHPFFSPSNLVSENICLTNYNSPNSNLNLQTDICNQDDNNTKITYQLSSQNLQSPIKTLKQNQSMLFQSPEITFAKQNYNNAINKSNSSNFTRKKNPCENNSRESIKNNISKKNELLDKIRYISNKIDKTINLYKDKNVNNMPQNNYNINTYNRKTRYMRNCPKKFPLNFKYNILETMKKENERQREIINMRIRNLSQVVNDPINLYRKMDTEGKRRKANYAKLNKQKKFYVDNNINLKINENSNKNVTYVYDPNSNQDKNNNYNEDESTMRKNNYQLIKNMKRNIYKRDITVKNKNNRDNNFFSENNRHKYNKNISEYISQKNKNNYNNHDYKEIIHKNEENYNENEMDNNINDNNNYEEQIQTENNHCDNCDMNDNYQGDINYDNRRNDCPQECDNIESNVNDLNKKINDNIPQNNINDENLSNKDIQIKDLNEQLNTSKVNYVLLENRYNELVQENESLKKQMDICAQEKSNYECHLSDLEHQLDLCCQKNHELELANKDLLSELNSYQNIENECNLIKKDNENIIIDNQRMKEEIDKKEKEYQNLINLNEEKENNFDALLTKHNDLLEKYNNINKENGQIKNELIDMGKKCEKLRKITDEIEFEKKNLSSDYNNNINKFNELNDAFNDLKNRYDMLEKNAFNLEKQNDQFRSMLEDKDINLCDLCKKIDMYKRKIENLNNKINMLNSEKSEEAKKFNNINSLYNQATKEMNKLERNLRENDLELANAKRENEINLNNLKDSTKKYNDDYNKLYNKLLNMQEEIDNLRKENEYLLNQNQNLTNDNQSLCQNNNEMISEYKKTIDKLKKENDELKNTLKSRKYNISNKKNAYEDEIVIVNKETTYSKGLFGQPNEFNKYGTIKNKYEIKRNADVKSDEIMKYHEIIQDLTNMVLIYEKFFFKGKVKPKNNHELFCYLLVQYINEKIKKIKLNTFMNLLYYNESNKENRPRINYLRRNNSNLGSRYENNRSSYTERGNSRKRGYFSDRNRINNEYN